MKIVYIITKADEIGGAQIHVKDLACEATKDGHDVEVVVGENGLFVQMLETMNIKVTILPDLIRPISIFKDFKATLALIRHLKVTSPDIVTLHSSKAGILGRIACKYLNLPVVFTAHGWAFADGVSNRKRSFYILIEKFFDSLSDKTITVSEEDKKIAIKYGVSKESKQIAIHNGIPDISMNFMDRKPAKKIRLIMVARFSNQKDHETLFKALSSINNKRWELDLVGKGPLINHYKMMVSDIGLDSNVNFLGERSDVNELLANSDIFLLISNWEGFPISILEAMRLGMPIIASDVGGVNEAISNGVNGFLIERKDYKELARVIDLLINEKMMRENVATQARETFEQKFTVNQMYNKTYSVYEGVVTEKRNSMKKAS